MSEPRKPDLGLAAFIAGMFLAFMALLLLFLYLGPGSV